MKLLGLIGGTSWESTAVYYRLLNEMAKAHLGSTHSQPMLIYSFDFDAVRTNTLAENWGEVARMMVAEARRLEAAGADGLMICANTMHRVANEVEAAISIPFIHLLDSLAVEAKARGFGTLGVLGTRFTMLDPFYCGRLEGRHGLKTLVPEGDDLELVHWTIFNELTQGRVLESTREKHRRVIERLAARGAQAIVLGCTEHRMMLSAEDSPVPLLDTTEIHCRKAFEFAR